jgi:hypothetical protein
VRVVVIAVPEDGVPVTVMVVVPAGAVEAAVKVRVELPAPVIEVELKAAVTPGGNPLAVRVTGESKPPATVSVTVEVPVLPAVTLAAVAESEKSGSDSALLPVVAPTPYTGALVGSGR